MTIFSDPIIYHIYSIFNTTFYRHLSLHFDRNFIRAIDLRRIPNGITEITNILRHYFEQYSWKIDIFFNK